MIMMADSPELLHTWLQEVNRSIQLSHSRPLQEFEIVMITFSAREWEFSRPIVGREYANCFN